MCGEAGPPSLPHSPSSFPPSFLPPPPWLHTILHALHPCGGVVEGVCEGLGVLGFGGVEAWGCGGVPPPTPLCTLQCSSMAVRGSRVRGRRLPAPPPAPSQPAVPTPPTLERDVRLHCLPHQGETPSLPSSLPLQSRPLFHPYNPALSSSSLAKPPSLPGQPPYVRLSLVLERPGREAGRKCPALRLHSCCNLLSLR